MSRIFPDDAPSGTPWWFPAKTDQGAMREDRLVLPIPPGLHWSDAMPVLVPSGETPKPRRVNEPEVGSKGRPLPPTPRPRNRVQFGPPRATPTQLVVVEQPKVEAKPKREPNPKAKIDPAMISTARELRDRYLEQVNDRVLIAPRGKYDVSRTLSAVEGSRPLPAPIEVPLVPLLKAG